MALLVFVLAFLFGLALHIGVGALLGLLAQFAIEGLVGHPIGQTMHWMAVGALILIVLGQLRSTIQSD